jgi:Rod binding domain-containing protein
MSISTNLSVAPISTSPTSPTSQVGQPKASEHAEKLHRAAQEFESLLIKQLLSAAKMGGQAKGGYADMGVDALATGVEKAGGLGLARRLEEAISPHTVDHNRRPFGAGAPKDIPEEG